MFSEEKAMTSMPVNLQERVQDWQEKFGRALGLDVLELTGDSDVGDSLALDAVDIICTTPEKFGEPACSSSCCCLIVSP